MIVEKIRKAHELFNGWEAVLREDARVKELSSILDDKISASARLMAELGVAEQCRICDEEEGGSCCGAGIENSYKPGLLLLNLLLGATLPLNRHLENSCYFLGKTGCTLRVRDILCSNFLCLRIQKMLSTQDLIRLQQVTGEEMDTVFLLNEASKKAINPGYVLK